MYNNRMITKGPGYGDQMHMEQGMNAKLSWWKPISTLIKMMDYPLQLSAPAPYKTEKELSDILQDFSLDQRSRKNMYEEWKKTAKKEVAPKFKKSLNPRANSSTKKMAERRE